MIVQPSRLKVTLVWIAATCFACDLPPDTAYYETDSEEPIETDSGFETDSETDSQAVGDKTCVQAVLCAVLNPEETLTCFSGLDDTDKAAALSVSICAAGACIDVADNLLNFGLCLVQSCGPESMDCVQTSLAGVFL